MPITITYHALLKNGSEIPIPNLNFAISLPAYSYLLKITTDAEDSGFFHSETYEFVDLQGNLFHLRMGEWEVVSINSRKFTTSKTLFTLYNHSTETAYKHTSDRLGLEFFEHGLFPKLWELAKIPDYEKYLLNKKVDSLESEIANLKSRIEILENKKQSI